MSMRYKSADSDFCSFCGSILPLPVAAPTLVSCRICLAQNLIRAKIDVPISSTERSYERTVADTEGAEETGGDSEVDHICPKCGHEKATYSTMQTRSADEGQTVFYTCCRCKQKSIEYS